MKKILILSIITVLLINCKENTRSFPTEKPKIKFFALNKNAYNGYIHYLVTTNNDSKDIDWIGYSPIEIFYKYLDTVSSGFPICEIIILSGNTPKKESESMTDYLRNDNNYIFDIEFTNKIYDTSKASKIRFFDIGRKFNYQSVNFSYYNKIFNTLK